MAVVGVFEPVTFVFVCAEYHCAGVVAVAPLGLTEDAEGTCRLVGDPLNCDVGFDVFESTSFFICNGDVRQRSLFGYVDRAAFAGCDLDLFASCATCDVDLGL
jgi:hypothetical protein